jgi:hypothetical protein
MAANTNPIYSLSANVNVGQTITTANTAVDGTGTVVTAFTASSEGSRVEKIKFRSKGTNVATVVRIFINNGSDPTVATNNSLYEELTLPATTISQVAQLLNQEITLNLVLPAGYKITVTIGTTVAAGYAITCVGGNY